MYINSYEVPTFGEGVTLLLKADISTEDAHAARALAYAFRKFVASHMPTYKVKQSRALRLATDVAHQAVSYLKELFGDVYPDALKQLTVEVR